MKRKALFIGGTGTISSAITARIAAEGEWDLTLLNRGNRQAEVPENVHVLKADIGDEAAVEKILEGSQWDCVCDFIGYVKADVERGWRPFREGVRRAVAHILAHPELRQPDPVFDAWCDRVIETLERAKAALA